MTKIKLLLVALFAGLLVAGCSVHGVSDYQRALHKGCTPESGGVYCSG